MRIKNIFLQKLSRSIRVALSREKRQLDQPQNNAELFETRMQFSSKFLHPLFSDDSDLEKASTDPWLPPHRNQQPPRRPHHDQHTIAIAQNLAAHHFYQHKFSEFVGVRRAISCDLFSSDCQPFLASKSRSN